jgi:hypothetical protein
LRRFLDCSISLSGEGCQSFFCMYDVETVFVCMMLMLRHLTLFKWFDLPASTEYKWFVALFGLPFFIFDIFSTLNIFTSRNSLIKFKKKVESKLSYLTFDLFPMHLLLTFVMAKTIQNFVTKTAMHFFLHFALQIGLVCFFPPKGANL